MHHVRCGTGRALLLIHGLGGSWRSWTPVLGALAREREVIAIDLPGFGETAPLAGEVSVATLADAVTGFLLSRDLMGIDAAGSSVGAQLVLELARRRVIGTAVCLDPGGFWQGQERRVFHMAALASLRLVRLLQPVMPLFTGNAAGRTLLLRRLSARPWAVPSAAALAEMRSHAGASSFDALLDSLVNAAEQPAGNTAPARGPIVIGWGRKDRVCPPCQAERALRRFPGARLHWFDTSGHFPHWDEPQETVRLILESTGNRRLYWPSREANHQASSRSIN
jgi:pimeloyl-ACP methyl ester carboxylesterase